MTWNNSTTRAVVEQGGYEIRQGPRWLAEWFVTPPEWLAWVIGLGFVLVPAVALYVAAVRGAEREQLLDVVSNGLIVGAVVLATSTAKSVMSAPYAVDVGVGVVAAVVAWRLAPGFVRWHAARIELLQDEKETESGIQTLEEPSE